jgi:hypothetical protein
MDQNWKEIYIAAKQLKDCGGNYLEVRPTFQRTGAAMGGAIGAVARNVDTPRWRSRTPRRI